MGFLTLTLTACVKGQLYDDCSLCSGAESGEGVAVVEVNLPDGTSSDDFTVEIDGTELDNVDGSRFQSDPLSAGAYDVLAYNHPEGFTITDGIAYVNAADGEDGFILSEPGTLYSGTERIYVEGNDTTRVNLDVDQRTKDVRIELTVVEGDPASIVSVTGVLYGIAGAYDLLNETLYGDPVSTAISFTTDGNLVITDLRILGFLGDVQTLTLTIVLANGQTIEVECDLSAFISTIDEEADAYIIRGNLHLPVDVEGNVVATITDWEYVEGKHIYAYGQ